MKELNDQSYLGIGWSFPPSFNIVDKEVEMVTNQQDIEQSLEMLLSTRQGERVMQPRYGCNLEIMLFEPLTITLITYVKDLVKKAILFYEARIDVNRIEVKADSVNNGIILIDVDYTIRSTNSRFNFVYPFYLEEGSNIKSNL
nr:GPW/gp25 family protein [uncultured Psychroserpens sp.]